MPRWKITLEYDGTGFSGWQRQDNAFTVQQAVEEAVLGFSQEEVRLQVAGRTDAGVHALAQVAHIDLAKETTAETLRDALNYYLREKPVSVLKAESVGEDFHARFSAKGRRYLYRVINRRSPLALEINRAYQVTKDVNITPMQEAATLILGQHDFSTFRAQNCQAPSPIKTMDEAEIERIGEEVRFHFAARSFLYHQVRNMVGSLLMVGTGQWSVAQFKEAFEVKDRKAGGPTAPSSGLYFVSVTY
jgi:tRNA pseudouridine38-40 synthase